MSDQEFADRMYEKYYQGKMKRADYDVKIGLVKAPTPEEMPKVNVGGTAFEWAAEAAKPFVDVAAGAVQHGAEVLHGLGIPVNPEAAKGLAQNIRLNYKDFVKRSMEGGYGTTSEEHPYAAATGNLSGELLLYSIGGTPFMEGKIGAGLMKAGPILGRVLQGMLTAGSLETLRSDKRPGVGLFTDALSASLSGGLGAGVGAYAGSKVTQLFNAYVRNGIVNQLSNASKGWTANNEALAKAFQGKAQAIDNTTQQLVGLAQQALGKDGIVLKSVLKDEIPSGASPEAVKAVKLVRDYVKQNEFMKSTVFSGLKAASDSGKTFYEANEGILKKIMGNDKELSQRVWKAFGTNERVLLQKGIVYNALEKSAVDGGKFDMGELGKALKTEGVKAFFPETSGKMIDGFLNLAEQANLHNVPGHSLAAANLRSRIAHHMVEGLIPGAAAAGYKRSQGADLEETLTAGLAGYLGYIALTSATNKLVGTQFGRNLLSASARVKPGTPQMARILDRVITLGGTSIGGMYGSEIPEDTAPLFGLTPPGQRGGAPSGQQSPD